MKYIFIYLFSLQSCEVLSQNSLDATKEKCIEIIHSIQSLNSLKLQQEKSISPDLIKILSLVNYKVNTKQSNIAINEIKKSDNDSIFDVSLIINDNLLNLKILKRKPIIYLILNERDLSKILSNNDEICQEIFNQKLQNNDLGSINSWLSNINDFFDENKYAKLLREYSEISHNKVELFIDTLSKGQFSLEKNRLLIQYYSSMYHKDKKNSALKDSIISRCNKGIDNKDDFCCNQMIEYSNQNLIKVDSQQILKWAWIAFEVNYKENIFNYYALLKKYKLEKKANLINNLIYYWAENDYKIAYTLASKKQIGDIFPKDECEAKKLWKQSLILLQKQEKSMENIKYIMEKYRIETLEKEFSSIKCR